MNRRVLGDWFAGSILSAIVDIRSFVEEMFTI
jgi:hypothetical protein